MRPVLVKEKKKKSQEQEEPIEDLDVIVPDYLKKLYTKEEITTYTKHLNYVVNHLKESSQNKKYIIDLSYHKL